MQVHKMTKRPVVVHEEVQPVAQLGLQPPVPYRICEEDIRWEDGVLNSPCHAASPDHLANAG